MTAGHDIALRQLRRVARASDGQLDVLAIRELPESRALEVDVSVCCVGFPSAPTGLRLRERERVTISIPPEFPFERPEARVSHRRFAGFPHVQWQHHLCLYAAPAMEWDPSDGMYGFVDRLDQWLQKAALDELDPVGAPVHPPVAYRTFDSGHKVVVRTNTPRVPENGWIGLAKLARVTESRVDVSEWIEFGADTQEGEYAAALLLSQPLAFEYPTTVRGLITDLEDRKVPRNLFFLVLQLAAHRNPGGTPLHVIIGTPTRGIRGGANPIQHLEAWFIDRPVADGLRGSLKQFSAVTAVKEIAKELEKLIYEWADIAPIAWCAVLEDRPETTERRDHSSVLSLVRGKAIALWGCGALGSLIAECLARAGVGRLVLHDYGVVKPGLLVRQIFEERDIGRLKVTALKERLLRIRRDLVVETTAASLERDPLGKEDWTDGVDLVIDSTGSDNVLAKLEVKRASGPRVCPVVSVAIDGDALRGMAVCARPEHSGGPYDLLRAAKIRARGREELNLYADAFWPRESRPHFRPEPGCSDPTFVGSCADVMSLAADLLNESISAAFGRPGAPGSAAFICRSTLDRPDVSGGAVRLEFQPDELLPDYHSGYEVRLSPPAARDLRAWVKSAARRSGPDIETGGALLGEIDEAVRVVWISEVTGPPPDSSASADGFVCGTEGLLSRTEEAERRTQRAVRFVGLWHTHPDDLPVPSPTDLHGMRRVVTTLAPSLPEAVMIIVGGDDAARTAGAYVFGREEAELKGPKVRTCSVGALPAPSVSRGPVIGLALSGGGSRAIAFELGCLRALHDLGLLDRVHVISSVSGGSVLATMYAYGQGSFSEFDRKTVRLLKMGLNRSLLREFLLTSVGIQALGTAATAGMAALAASAIRFLLPRRYSDQIRPPFARWVSRTNAFERALRREVVGEAILGDRRRHDVNVVINACDLRTGSAVRYGSVESGCWRYGRLTGNKVRVSEAVASSAAYPFALPALDRELSFTKNGRESLQRLAISDGGVYDNLGITGILPGRDAAISTNVFPVEYIISCDAGHGLLEGTAMPYWFLSRVKQSYLTTYQRAQAAMRQRLHALRRDGTLRGFVLCYLGQDDDRLPWRPPDLIPRSVVNRYPTNFAPMRTTDIDLLTGRGEQLMRLLVPLYLPEL